MYLTTAISYANGPPHIGHAFEFIIADAIARFHRLNGKTVFFLTGMDEHGQKIQKTAEEQKITPIMLCDSVSDLFKKLDVELNISYDRFIRTTENDHKQTVYELFDKCMKNDDIYLGEYIGWYNPREENFVSEFEASQTNYKDPVTNKDFIKMKEPSYFFRLSKYGNRIKQFLLDNPDFIIGCHGKTEIINRLEQNELHDISISRTTVAWGIPLKDDPKHVFYVWFDALTNYLTGNIGMWPASVHIIGKDIVWFHSVIWLGMLFSAGLPPPKQLCVHGFVNDSEGRKMSKSVGNVVSPTDLIQKYPSCAIRYFLLKENVLNDINFSEQQLVRSHDSELLEIFGNLVNRVMCMFHKYCNSTIPDCTPEPLFNIQGIVKVLEDAMDKFQVHIYIETVMALAAHVNKYVNDTKIWDVGKNGDIRTEKDRQIVLRTLLESFYVLGHFMYPIIPNTCSKLVSEILEKDFVTLDALTYCNLTPNHVITKRSAILFNILDTEAYNKRKEKSIVKDKKKEKKTIQ